MFTSSASSHSLTLAKLVVVVAVGFLSSLISAASELEVVQAQVPPRKSFKNPSCQQTLFQHSFANSYGVPYVGTYSPPKNCRFTTTVFNISVTSEGRQYDRLALLFLGDIEVWRTSTAMPTENGIYWSYQKDMTGFDPLLRTDQKVIFDLSNVYTDLYTGAFNIILEALYFNDEYTSPLTPPNAIYPISALASAQNVSSVMSLPDSNGTVSIQFPRNIKTATVSILASGNSAEEFWYTNVPSEYVNSYPSNPGWLYGYSPFREVQLLIDGNLAGVSWPFPLLFTGGVDPGLWRPIVGIETYDLPTFEIDVTPWLGLLCDGKTHDFQLKVIGFDSSVDGNIGTVGQNWYVTGNVYIWLDEKGKQTTGSASPRDPPATFQSSNISQLPTIHTPAPSFEYKPQLATITDGNTTSNGSFYFSLLAHRTLSISSTIHLSTGPKTATWTQNLSTSNIQNMTSLAFNQSLSLLTTQTFKSSLAPITSTYTFPLNLYSAYIIAPSLATLSSVYTLIDRSLLTTGISLLSQLTGLTAGKQDLSTRQNGTSMYYWNETIVEGTDADKSDMQQWFSFEGKSGLKNGGVDVYSRVLREVDDRITVDVEMWEGIKVPSTVALPAVEGEPVV